MQSCDTALYKATPVTFFISKAENKKAVSLHDKRYKVQMITCSLFTYELIL